MLSLGFNQYLFTVPCGEGATGREYGNLRQFRAEGCYSKGILYCKTNVREDKMLFTIFGFLGCFRARDAVLQVREVYCFNKFKFFLLLETGSLQCLYYSHFCRNNRCMCPGRRYRVLRQLTSPQVYLFAWDFVSP